MRYREAYNYLNSFTDFEKVPGANYTSGMADLDRVRLLLRLLGRPQESFSSIVIAGTKGKGSVAAILDSILRQGGYKIGLYTSPHLHTFRERIRVHGLMIRPRDVVRLVERIAPVVKRIQGLDDPTLVPTTYELATALAFLYFQENGIDIAVLEVGLGGRLDAVNVTTPLVSIITSISLDHTQVLGNTLAEIAWEKAGIIKPGVQVVTAPQDPEAMGVIKAVAVEKGANLVIVGRAVYISTRNLPRIVFDKDGTPVHQEFTIGFESQGDAPEIQMRLNLPLLGAHQQVNAAVAMATLPILMQAGYRLERDAVQKGLSRVNWPGRIEVVHRDPLVVVDGAHNVASFARLQEAIAQLFYRRKVVIVLGVSRDKDLEGIVGQIASWVRDSIMGPEIERLILTRSRHPRAADPLDLVELAQKQQLPVEIASTVESAIKRAEEVMAGTPNGNDTHLILVTGSLFAVAEAREHYGLAPDLSEED